MAITVKKKTLKLKTGTPEGADTPAEEKTQSVIAAMPASSASAPQKGAGGAFVVSFVMALIACLLLGTLIAVQFAENSFYVGVLP